MFLKQFLRPLKLICNLSNQFSPPSCQSVLCTNSNPFSPPSNLFAHSQSKFPPPQDGLDPFKSICAPSDQFLPSQTYLHPLKPILAPLNLFPTSQNKYSSPYTNLCLIKLICTLVNQFVPIQTNLCHFVFPNKQFGPTSNQSVSLPLI